jgi:uncharacterized membrane protein
MLESLNLWLEYLLRFSHLVSGIAWIGSSFYFIWLDSSFENPETPRRNVDGELYMVHGGFYYQVEKRKIFPGELPKVLHWFKWEATLTWITGFALLIAVYYLDGASLLVDKQVMPLSQWQAVGLSLALAVCGWFIYDFIWHRLENKKIAVVLSLLLLGLLTFINFRTFSGRGAFIQTAFVMGSMMLLNVWVRILPGQKKMVADAQAGKVPDYSFSAKAKTRSVHNTYFIFPVLFIMISNHYAPIYNHPQNWLLLLVLSVSSAMVRHAMVTKKNSERWVLLPAAIGLISLVAVTATAFKKSNHNFGLIEFHQVKPIFEQRCNTCHGSNPTDDIIKIAPGGMIFEEENVTKTYLSRIYQQVNVAKSMPLANKTGITEDERAMIGAWVQQEMKKIGQ